MTADEEEWLMEGDDKESESDELVGLTDPDH